MTSSKDNRFEDFFADDAYVSLKNHLYNYLLRRQAIQKCMQNDKRDNILEVGSGLSPIMDGSNGIIYTELSLQALRVLKKSQERGSFVTADAVHLPFQTASFSHVICSEVLEHLPEDQRALQEMSAVLKQGGSLILTFPHRRSYFAHDDRFVNHIRRYELGEIVTMLDEAGLKTVEIQKVLGPLEKITMLAIILLIQFFDRFRSSIDANNKGAELNKAQEIICKLFKGKRDCKHGKRMASAGCLFTLFVWLNRLYAAPVWLDAKLVPRAFATVLLIRAVKR